MSPHSFDSSSIQRDSKMTTPLLYVVDRNDQSRIIENALSAAGDAALLEALEQGAHVKIPLSISSLGISGAVLQTGDLVDVYLEGGSLYVAGKYRQAIPGKVLNGPELRQNKALEQFLETANCSR